MMPHRSAQPWVLFAGPDAWRVARLSAAPADIKRLDVTIDADPAAVAEAVSQITGPATLMLALGSSWCLCSVIDNQPPSRHWRSAMLYELEQHLPIPAEQVVADYVVVGDRALAVAADLHRLTPLVEAMRSQSILVEGIYPAAFLAVEHMQHAGLIGDADAVVFAEGSGAALVQLAEASGGGKPIDWHWMAADPDAIADRIVSLPATVQRVLTCGLKTPLSQALSGRPITCEALPTESGDMWTQAAAGAWAAHRGRWRPSINLARGPLASKTSVVDRQRAVRFALAAALVLGLATNAALMIRSYRYDRRIAEQKAEQQRYFAQVLPGSAPSALIARRMESEYRALTQSRENSPVPADDLPMLRMIWDVFSPLSNEPNVTLSKVSVNESTVTITGQAPDEAMARQLVERMAGESPVQYDSPRMQAEEGRVRFVLSGRWSVGGSSSEGREVR